MRRSFTPAMRNSVISAAESAVTVSADCFGDVTAVWMQGWQPTPGRSSFVKQYGPGGAEMLQAFAQSVHTQTRFALFTAVEQIIRADFDFYDEGDPSEDPRLGDAAGSSRPFRQRDPQRRNADDCRSQNPRDVNQQLTSIGSIWTARTLAAPVRSRHGCGVQHTSLYPDATPETSVPTMAVRNPSAPLAGVCWKRTYEGTPITSEVGASLRVRGTAIPRHAASAASGSSCVCGEQDTATAARLAVVGASLRVRGTALTPPPSSLRCRVIPACAGNRIHANSLLGRKPGHPCVCGEQGLGVFVGIEASGSSLRVRGTEDCSFLALGTPRVIPACAGNRLSELVRNQV